MSWKTVKVFICDRCGKEAQHYNTLGATWFGFMQKRDVCQACYEEFSEWFFNRTPKSPAPQVRVYQDTEDAYKDTAPAPSADEVKK